MVKKPIKDEKIAIKIEPPDPKLKELKSCSKRKHEDDSEGENTLTLYEGIKVSQDGNIIREKKKKQKVLTEEEKLQKERKQEKEKVQLYYSVQFCILIFPNSKYFRKD